MKKLKTLLFAGLFASAALQTQAKTTYISDNVYAGVDLGVLFFDEDLGAGIGDASFDIITLQGRLGYQFDEYFSVEGRLMTGLDDDQDTKAGVRLDLDWEYTIAAYVKGQYPLCDVASIYGIAGIAHSELDISGSVPGVVVTASESGTDFSFGIGADYNLNDAWSANIEWAWLHNAFDEDDGEAAQLSGGFTYRF